MVTSRATAKWTGTLKDGRETMRTGSGAFDGEFSFGTRFQDSAGTSPEELIGAAQAGCYSMALAARMEKAGFRPASVKTDAEVDLEQGEGGYHISCLRLKTQADVRGMDRTQFRQHAEAAAEQCVVSKALAGIRLEISAQLSDSSHEATATMNSFARAAPVRSWQKTVTPTRGIPPPFTLGAPICC